MRVLQGHTDAVRCVAFAPDGQSLASASYDGTVRLWDTHTSEQLLDLRPSRFPGRRAFLCVALSLNGTSLAAGDGPSGEPPAEVLIWDLPSGRQRLRLGSNKQCLQSLAFTSDGRTLAVAGSGPDSEVQLWDADRGQPQERLSCFSWRSPGQAEVRTIAFSPDGQTLAGGTELRGESLSQSRRASRAVTGEVLLWAWRTGGEPPRLRGHAHAVFSLAFSPDGRTLVTGSADRTVRIWDLATRQERAILRGHTSPVHGVAFMPDGSTIASAGTDGTVRLCDVVTGQLKAVYDWEIGHVNCVAFAPDGMTAAAAGANGSIVLWDIDLPM